MEVESEELDTLPTSRMPIGYALGASLLCIYLVCQTQCTEP